jgi:hypothetical protein
MRIYSHFDTKQPRGLEYLPPVAGFRAHVTQVSQCRDEFVEHARNEHGDDNSDIFAPKAVRC